MGYWNKPEKAGKAFIEIGGRGISRTGDLGYMGGGGYFFIV